ncbi:MAG TPA: methionine adenosyltransferase domain-containing protein [Candidatus Acidoferrum sp.]|nr:methionine adenosyltransferase domain-containing protein [Candidatus Acidoferrum sp.]
MKKKLSDRVEIHVAYAIGMSRPISIKIDTFGSGDAGAVVGHSITASVSPSCVTRRHLLELILNPS